MIPINKKVYRAFYYLFAKLVSLLIVFVLAKNLGGFAEYAVEIIKILIAAQIITAGSQLLVQQAARKITVFSIANVLVINIISSILYIKITGITASLVWGMVFSTCIPILIAYNSGKNGRRGEVVNMLSIIILQPIIYYYYKCFEVNLNIFQFDYLLFSLLVFVVLFIADLKKIPLEIKLNYFWRTTEIALTQGVLLYFAEKLLHKSTGDEIITYWLLLQLASGIIFLANSFSYSIINYYANVSAGKNHILAIVYKIGAFSMGFLLFLTIITSYIEIYFGVFLIVQGIMKFPGYALLGQNKSHVLFVSNASAFAFLMALSFFIDFDSFSSYLQIQMAAALIASLLAYLQLRRQNLRLAVN